MIQRLTQETARAAKQVFTIMELNRTERTEVSVRDAVEVYMVWKGLLGCAEGRDLKKEYLAPDQVAKAVSCLPAGHPDTRKEVQKIYDICLPKAEHV